MASTESDGTTARDRSQTGGSSPNTRCNECLNEWNENVDGRKCPECGALGHPRRSERADFGGGEASGVDEL